MCSAVVIEYCKTGNFTAYREDFTKFLKSDLLNSFWEAPVELLNQSVSDGGQSCVLALEGIDQRTSGIEK